MSPLAPRIEPDSPAVGLAHRALMARGLSSVAPRRDRGSRAVAAALRDTALGRIPPEERAWVERIEANRRRLADGLDDPEAVRWMSLPPVWGRFLLRLVRELAPASCIELGTGFGLSTAYQAAALELNDSGSIVSFDVEDMIAIAKPGLRRVELDGRVELVAGMIERTLAAKIEEAGAIDYALIDHDHTEEGTLAGFDAIASHLAEGAVVVFDDISWTDEMRRAWRAVAARRRVVATLGLRRLGIATLGPSGGER